MRRLLSLLLLLTQIAPVSAQVPGDPISAGFTPLEYPCSVETDAEFHPLRPYPASPCDPLIPRKIREAPLSTNPPQEFLTFTCNTSANPSGNLRVEYSGNPDSLADLPSDTANMQVDQFYRDGDQVCVLKRINYEVEFNFNSSRFPILGNTETTMSDAEKVNHFLSWYLQGVVQQSEQAPLNPDSDYDMNRLINYSGPVKKLLSQDTLNVLRDELDSGSAGTDYHNSRTTASYLPPSFYRITNTPQSLWENMPLSSLEDITAEFTVSIENVPQPASLVADSVHQTTLTIGADPNADSRLYFPHLRSSNAASLVLSGLIRPRDEPDPALDPNRQLVSQEITLHQGIDDSTPVFNRSNRNTEIRPNQPAPPPLMNPLPDPITCNQDNVRTNPGDKLVGSIVRADLVYHQVVCADIPTSRPQPCVSPGDACVVGGTRCCYRTCNANGICPRNITAVSTEGSSANIAVFTKTPIVEKIYFTLISSPQSILHRFAPSEVGNVNVNSYIKTWPDTIPAYTDAYYGGSSPDLSAEHVTAGENTSPPQIYFPHLGSMSDYLLGGGLPYENLNLQRILRPQTTPAPTTSPVQTPAGVLQHLFETTCGSTCYSYLITRAITESPCNGEVLNPYFAIAIALNENGGLVSCEPGGTRSNHYGCDTTGAIGFANTIQDKTTCMINTLTNSCRQGLSDLEILQNYGYTNGAANLSPLPVLNSPTTDLFVSSSQANSYANALRGLLPTQRDQWWRYYCGYINNYAQNSCGQALDACNMPPP